jgi:hypothetical protein
MDHDEIMRVMAADGTSNLGRADLSPGLHRKGARSQIRVTEARATVEVSQTLEFAGQSGVLKKVSYIKPRQPEQDRARNGANTFVSVSR